MLREHLKRERLRIKQAGTLRHYQQCSGVPLHYSIAIISIGCVLIGGARMAGIAVIVYMLTGVAMAVHGTVMGKRRRRLQKTLAATAELESA
jgi:urease gamma subunit